MRRNYAIAVSGVLVLSLIIPLIVFLVTTDDRISTMEKRKLSPLPNIQWDIDSLRNYPAGFNAYYQDHFGLRDELIGLYDSAVVTLLKSSPSPFVLIGRGNWYFYVAGNVGKDFYGLSLYDDQLLEIKSQVLIDRRDWLHSLGIQYIFLPVPNKINVYPEYLPEKLQKISGRTQYQQLLENIQDEMLENNLIDTLALLRKAKGSHHTYYRTDTHWSYDGALDVFNQMVLKLKNWFPELQIIGEEDIVRSANNNFTGDIKNVLHKIQVVSESETIVSLVSPCSREKNSPIPLSLSNLIEKSKQDRKFLPVQNGCETMKYSALVLHDSYGEFLQQYFNKNFKRVIYSREYSFNDLKRLIKALRPDIVIEEGAARNFNTWIVPDVGLEDEVVEYQMKVTSAELINIPIVQKPDFFTAVNQMSVSSVENGYLLTSTSTDPQILMPFLPSRNGRRYNVMVEITAPEDTSLQLFYTTRKNSDFSRKYSVTRQLKRGYNKIYFHLPGTNNFGKIRLDPGSVIGDYVLHSFVIKERPLTFLNKELVPEVGLEPT